MKILPFKIKVTPNQSAQIQEVLFTNGYAWNGGDKLVHNINTSKLLYFSNNILTCGNMIAHFDQHPGTEITFEQFKNLYMNANVETSRYEINITAPAGFEIDKDLSTFDCIRFKEIKPINQPEWKEHMPNNWDDIGELNGYYVTSTSTVESVRKDGGDNAYRTRRSYYSIMSIDVFKGFS